MTKDPSVLSDLLERVKACKGADRSLDFRLAYFFGWRFNGFARGDDYEPNDHDFEVVEDLAGHWRQPDGRYANIASDRFDPKVWPDPPEWSASIDEALALVERVGKDTYRVGVVEQPGRNWAAVILRVEPDSGECPEVMAPTAPLAILAALLTALSTEAQSQPTAAPTLKEGEGL
jgi:hypothetical protein